MVEFKKLFEKTWTLCRLTERNHDWHYFEVFGLFMWENYFASFLLSCKSWNISEDRSQCQLIRHKTVLLVGIPFIHNSIGRSGFGDFRLAVLINRTAFYQPQLMELMQLFCTFHVGLVCNSADMDLAEQFGKLSNCCLIHQPHLLQFLWCFEQFSIHCARMCSCSLSAVHKCCVMSREQRD